MPLDENVSKSVPSEMVDDFVDHHTSVETADELFNFGKLLCSNHDDRVKTIESKALSIIGYSSAILAFLATRTGDFARSPLVEVCLLIVAVSAASACVISYLAVRTAAWKSLGEQIWFPDVASVLEKPGDLKRWYIKAMHEMYGENRLIANQKSNQMKAGQWCVAIAGVALAAALFINSIGGIFAANPCLFSDSRQGPYWRAASHSISRYPAGFADSRSFAQCPSARVVRRKQARLANSRDWRVVLVVGRLDFPDCRRPDFGRFVPSNLLLQTTSNSIA